MRTTTRARSVAASLIALAMALTMVLTVVTPATAEIQRFRGRKCKTEDNVQRCAWINVDTSNNRWRGYTSIMDKGGGPQRDVAVNQIQAWTVVAFTNDWYLIINGGRTDNDGWHGTRDEGSTKLHTCGKKIKSRSRFQWKPGGGDPNYRATRWMSSSPITC